MLEEKLKDLGIEIPEAPMPLASYIPSTIVGNLVYTAGQVPLINGKLKNAGLVGRDISMADAQEAAKTCAINCLGAVKKAIGDLNKIKRIVKLTVFVASEDGFVDQPKVANGASDLLVEIFGENGKHVRSAVGVTALPLNAPVEIEMIVELK
ncbi:MAG: RidA family protein [Melioribacteraceae bacterium]|nr:RidA family protein [Melioribacteraceae bacterium]RJP59201.1 MAG: RidA family protein [Ignavibacteriales bacterium]WKZ70579.1 MAG: RidA family protein [Melioribacteraceae bacterium]